METMMDSAASTASFVYATILNVSILKKPLIDNRHK